MVETRNLQAGKPALIKGNYYYVCGAVTATASVLATVFVRVREYLHLHLHLRLHLYP
jgi:hypothetical protein